MLNDYKLTFSIVRVVKLEIDLAQILKEQLVISNVVILKSAF